MHRHASHTLRALVLCAILAAAADAQSRLFLAEYQYNNPKLTVMDLDGGNPQALFDPPSAEWLLVGLDYDAQTDRLYWLHGSTPGTIRRAAPDGSDMQLLVSGLKIPRGLAIDRAGEKIYWSAAPPAGNASGLIQRANLDGTGVETFYAVDPYDPVLSYVGPPTVDATNGYVYFCAQNEIRRKRADGTGAVETVVRGVTTVRGIALDIPSQRIYFLDANTNSDYLGQCRFDDTNFRVLYDMSPGVNVSSGLFGLLLDLYEGHAIWTDELAHETRRCDLVGAGFETIHASPANRYPIGLAFDADLDPPISDCNGNGIPDREDIDGGGSLDCNGNGVPDDCEDDPCAAVAYLIDHGSDPVTSGRSLSGDPSTGYEIFQPFDVDEEVALARIDLDGWTVNHHPDGFRATLFPDDGTGGFAEELSPIEAVDFAWRFSGTTIVWASRPLTATLTPGRYWIRLTAADPDYDASAHVGLTGLPSLSRRNSNGQVVPASRSIAMRLVARDPAVAQDGDRLARLVDLRLSPNPASGRTDVGFSLGREEIVRLTVHDVAGRRVRALHEERLPAGSHTVVWDGRDDSGRPVESGIYYVALEVDGVRSGRPLSWVR